MKLHIHTQRKKIKLGNIAHAVPTVLLQGFVLFGDFFQTVFFFLPSSLFYLSPIHCFFLFFTVLTDTHQQLQAGVTKAIACVLPELITDLGV